MASYFTFFNYQLNEILNRVLTLRFVVFQHLRWKRTNKPRRYHTYQLTSKVNQKPEEIQEKMGLASRLKLQNLPTWVHWIGLGGTGIVFFIFLILFLLYKEIPVWDGWTPANEFLNPEYGERIYPESIFRTRMNTWSNLVYICFGFYAIALAIYDAKRKLPLMRGYLSSTPVVGFLFGLAGIYLGLGSGFFHASLTRYGQQCDVGGMYAMMICLAGIAVGSWLPRIQFWRKRKLYPSWPIIAALVIIGSVYFSYYKWEYSFSEISSYLTSILFLFAFVSLIQPGKYLQVGWFVAGVLAIILGSEVRDLDIADQFTGPDSIFQGHALWHVLSCLLFVFLYLYFRSEEREDF